MIKKGIFGGTFDPIHIGHIYIAQEAIWKLGLEKLMIMPSGNPPHKRNKHITEGKLRYEMAKQAVKDRDGMEVSDYEIKKEEFSYTFQTIEYFNEKDGNNTEWYFICGCDCLFDLDKWKNVDRIMQGCTLAVFKRSGYSLEEIHAKKKEVEEKYKKDILFLDIPLLEISSTYIRKCIGENKNISFFLPEGVQEIINKNELYKKEEDIDVE
ncbi:nicotinate-nucleotide adenylyltransferase [Clostridium sp. 19966]|uniref:nicotinate-nucleotide adenylyltransferase n=1 Tax=Clostridium sp. 19966 TaxID=2768166 RepID=UPI0028DEA70F|nr:nicotinate-nucleotide adenylyltransferase [Clostridium sp. 19966]MDT8715290.1 nicotinate-nucleotide adenylyltransferase [Clostridium sp. 19966]